MLKKMRAVAPVLMVLGAVTGTVVQGFGPKMLQSIHKPRRLVWEEHKVDIRRRGLVRRMYRMDEHTFDKLAELLRPIIERNDYVVSLRQTPFYQLTIVHWTKLLYMVRTCSSARECCFT